MGLFDTFTANSVSRVSSSILEARSIVTQGLTSLVMSKLPRTNAIPGAFGNIMTQTGRAIVGDGLVDVFSAIGMPTNSRLASVNPQMWQNGVNAARQVYTDMRAGNNQSDIINSAVDPLSEVKYNHDILPDEESPIDQAQGARYSPYAMDLFRLAPKHKFLFVCEFVFNGGYDFIGSGESRKNEFATIITNFERPKIKYEYDEVNMYNFRTKVVKKVTYDPVSIRFLDDRQNLSMKFFHEYMKATHPLMNVDPTSSDFYEINGMNFDDAALYSGSFTSLPTDTKTILKEIKVYHIFDFGTTMNIYHFTNPRLLGITLDHWAMDESDGNTVIGEFGFDATYIELDVPVDQNESETISVLSNTGTYSLHPAASQGQNTNSLDLPPEDLNMDEGFI